MISSYRDLLIWQNGITLTHEIYLICKKIPKEEQFGLISQMQRAAVSVPSNIAEGHARDSTHQYLYHLSVAKGSLAELETQLIISEKLNYINKNELQVLLKFSKELGKMINGLQRSLRKKVNSSQSLSPDL